MDERNSRTDPGRVFDTLDACARLAGLLLLAGGMLSGLVPGGHDVLLKLIAVAIPPLFGLPAFVAAPLWALLVGALFLGGAALTLAVSRVRGVAPLVDGHASNLALEGLRRAIGAGVWFLGALVLATLTTALVLFAGMSLAGPAAMDLLAWLAVPFLAGTLWTMTPRYWLDEFIDRRLRSAGGRVHSVPAGFLRDAVVAFEAVMLLSWVGFPTIMAAGIVGGAAMLLAGAFSGGEPVSLATHVLLSTVTLGTAALIAWRWAVPNLRTLSAFELRRIEAGPDGALRFFGSFAIPLGKVPDGAKVGLVTRTEKRHSRRRHCDFKRHVAWLEATWAQGDTTRSLRIRVYESRHEPAPWLAELESFLAGPAAG